MASVKIRQAFVLCHEQEGIRDVIQLELDLPANWPEFSPHSPLVHFEVARGKGVEYVRKFIGVIPQVCHPKERNRG